MLCHWFVWFSICWFVWFSICCSKSLLVMVWVPVVEQLQRLTTIMMIWQFNQACEYCYLKGLTNVMLSEWLIRTWHLWAPSESSVDMLGWIVKLSNGCKSFILFTQRAQNSITKRHLLQHISNPHRCNNTYIHKLSLQKVTIIASNWPCIKWKNLCFTLA